MLVNAARGRSGVGDDRRLRYRAAGTLFSEGKGCWKRTQIKIEVDLLPPFPSSLAWGVWGGCHLSYTCCELRTAPRTPAGMSPELHQGFCPHPPQCSPPESEQFPGPEVGNSDSPHVCLNRHDLGCLQVSSWARGKHRPQTCQRRGEAPGHYATLQWGQEAGHSTCWLSADAMLVT